jgi:exodeoxyribonuclease VII large subunit
MALKTYKMTKIPMLAIEPDRDPSVLSVSGLTKAIRGVLEDSFLDVTVEGEISNFVDHRSGHRYFTLKDSESQISCVFWKTRFVNFDIRDGMKVICRGRLTVYPPRGNYQLDVFQLRPSGIGELQQAYEELYRRLSNEGLFDESRKRPIPRFPKTIGIVTSENGAALQDILTVLRRRYPVVRVILRPVAVQGVGAELEIARAIQEFNLLGTESGVRGPGSALEGFGVRGSGSVGRKSNPKPQTPDPGQRAPDVIIVGRGGGSLEDLWSFNEEAVARAIFASKIPVISAVGHEVDVTIADFVADLRAPTPTAAAELATPDREELESIMDSVQMGLIRLMRQMIREKKYEVERGSDSAFLAGNIMNAIQTRRERMNAEILNASTSVVHSLERRRLHLERDSARLSAMNPDRVLDRGYTALESLDGEIIPRLQNLLSLGEKNGILIFADGRITVRFD